MIIRKYLVNDMNEAMLKIKSELGSEATIISNKKVREPGIVGLFKKKRLEVTAAVDNTYTKESKEKVESFQPPSKTNSVEKEINEIKKMIESIGINTSKAYMEIAATKDSKRPKIIETLEEIGVTHPLIDEIENSINIMIESSDIKITEKEVNERAINILENLIRVSEDNGGRIKVLVGPTGVGKTTTIAKLASMYTLYKNKKVGLITLDTYRIGAVEQLRTYAEILNIPFEVVISSKDIKGALDKMEECDVVLVDTTGRSSKNFMQISEIRNLVKEFEPDSINLVVSMTTKDKDIKSIIENYKILNYQGIILTKLDETDSYGSVINSLYYSRVPLSFICTGQDVPDDIEVPSINKIHNMILGEMKDGSSC
ncbi:MAG: flagellar biosynthesis protein FlhF [Clostridium sp.]|uniref:flagellar biosynthesis protein FlhF n=1 Tax=Clostridium sp. TaxID=1506 RepID=UPI002FC8D569